MEIRVAGEGAAESSLQAARAWVNERLRWERFLAEVARGPRAPRPADPEAQAA